MITPEIGNIAYATDGQAEKGELPNFCPAIIVKVWGDRLVNLTIFAEDGRTFNALKVLVVQEGDSIPKHTAYCQLTRPPLA